MPIISDKPRLVPKASSPTRSLFSSEWQYSQNSFSKSLRAHSTPTSRAPSISSTSGVVRAHSLLHDLRRYSDHVRVTDLPPFDYSHDGHARGQLARLR